MQAHTKKHHTEHRVAVTVQIRPENIPLLNRFVADIEAETRSSDITADEFFEKHFTGMQRWAVALVGYRTRQNLTQKQLAALAGIPQHQISEMEHGKRTIGKERARRLAQALDCDYRRFL